MGVSVARNRSNFGLDELELDALTELVNIGVSRAATNLRDMVGKQVFLSVPSVAITSMDETAQLIGTAVGGVLIAVRQRFAGVISGSALLIFPEKNSLELVRAVAGSQLSFEEILEFEQEAIAEVGNVILNGCMATIANLLRRKLQISLPEVLTGSAVELLEGSQTPLQEIIVFIHIDFTVKGRDLSGYVAMIMDLPSLEALKKLIDEFIRRNTA